MSAVTNFSDFGAQEDKISQCFYQQWVRVQQWVRIHFSPQPGQQLLFAVHMVIAILSSVRSCFIVVLICIFPED